MRMASQTWTRSPREPKICLVTDCYETNPNSIAKSANRLILNLHDAGYEMHVFVLADSPPVIHEHNHTPEFPYIRRIPSDPSRLYPALNFWQEQVGFDIFHGTSIPSASACLPIAWHYGRPLVSDISRPPGQSFQDRQTQAVLRHSSWIIADTPTTLGRAHAIIDIARRSSVVPTSIDAIEIGEGASLPAESMDVAVELAQYRRIYAQLLDKAFLNSNVRLSR
jgi:hypothetical protein